MERFIPPQVLRLLLRDKSYMRGKCLIDKIIVKKSKK